MGEFAVSGGMKSYLPKAREDARSTSKTKSKSESQGQA